MLIRSLVPHPEYLVLLRPEIATIDYSAELPINMLTVLQLVPACSVVAGRKVAEWIPDAVAVISKKDIEPIFPSKYRTAVFLVVNKLIADGNELSLHVQWKDEGPSPCITEPPCAPGQPGVVGEAPDGLSELSAHQHQGVADIVALLVEGGRLEAVLRGPEELLDSNRVAEDVSQEFQLLLLCFLQYFRCCEQLKDCWNGFAGDNRIDFFAFLLMLYLFSFGKSLIYLVLEYCSLFQKNTEGFL